MIHGGGGGRAEGTDARPIRPRMGPGRDRPPAGRMTRAGRSGTSPAPGAVAGRPAAGGLSSGTVAHGGHDVRQPKGPGWAVDADRPGRDPHARVFEGGRFAFRAGGSSRPRRISGRLGLDSGREQPPWTQAGPSLPACRESASGGPAARGRWFTSGGALAIPALVWRRSPMSCARVSGLCGSRRHPRRTRRRADRHAAVTRRWPASSSTSAWQASSGLAVARQVPGGAGTRAPCNQAGGDELAVGIGDLARGGGARNRAIARRVLVGVTFFSTSERGCPTAHHG